MNNAEIRDALTDRTAVAATILGEARGEPLLGWIAVAWVIRRRLFDPRWPATAKEVCLQPFQFSCWNGGDANSARTMAYAERLTSELPIDEDDDRRLAQALWITDGVLSGACPDVTEGADHYLTAQLARSAPPSWYEPTAETARIGAHVFLRA